MPSRTRGALVRRGRTPRFGPRDGAILGGLLGSIVGVLYGWLVLSVLMEWGGMMSVVLGLLLGAGLMAGDGFLLGLRTVPTAEMDQ